MDFFALMLVLEMPNEVDDKCTSLSLYPTDLIQLFFPTIQISTTDNYYSEVKQTVHKQKLKPWNC